VNDDDRARLATPHGNLMLGPIERERCDKHRRRWKLFRWVWSKDGDISAAEPEIVRSCAQCLEEDRRRDDE
jgi:hypothetical protein